MKTKLVYVLTCAPEATYIEQALMSVWSARHWNADAHIVLITDNLTDKLLIGKRGEILNYISEKIVVPFEDDKDVGYRSRWLKTQTKLFVEGDILFLDCDTIVTGPLDEVDAFECEIGLVPDEHIKICEEEQSLFDSIDTRCRQLGVNHSAEEYYFNSGVMYVKHTETTLDLFRRWFSVWEYSYYNCDFLADQPALAKVNIEFKHIISKIDDVWNTLVPTEVETIYKSKILHFWNYRNASVLFSHRVLKKIRDVGLSDYVKYFILHPTESFLPYDNKVYHFTWREYVRLYKSLSYGIRQYALCVDKNFEDFRHWKIPYCYAWYFMKIKCYRMASLSIVVMKYYRVHRKKYKYISNICKK